MLHGKYTERYTTSTRQIQGEAQSDFTKEHVPTLHRRLCLIVGPAAGAQWRVADQLPFHGASSRASNASIARPTSLPRSLST